MELNEQQERAVTFTGVQRNILVQAGAGCGKTRTIIARVARLCRTGTNPARILVMTFTNRSARELQIRLKSEIGESSALIQAGTFHAFCLKVMTRIPKSFGLDGLVILDSDDQESLMGRVRTTYVAQHPGSGRDIPKAPKLVSYYSYSRNTCIDPKVYLHRESDLDDPVVDACLEIFESYQAAKRQRGYLDYDDLLKVFADSLESKTALRSAVCSLYDEVLVDEMQDTNPIQFNILHQFSRERVRLFCVGDPAQSIYRFRGAEFTHVHNFTTLLDDSIVLPLSINYRSNQEILDFANWLLSRSTLQYGQPLHAHRGIAGTRPHIEDFEHTDQEAAWIADHIEFCAEQAIPLSEIMVLYRSAYDARPLEAELVRRKIPYRFIGGMVLTRAAHVRDVLSLLRVVRDGRDELAWMRYLQLWPRIGERTAGRVVDALLAGSGGTVAEVLEKQLGYEHPAVGAYRVVGKSYTSALECVKGACQALSPVLGERYDHWLQRRKDLDLLEKASSSYHSIAEFIDDFTLEPMNDLQIEQEGVEDAVTLITVHSAKGTEARVCVVAAAIQSNYPHFRSLGNLDAEEEERRVLYVAMTRAKDELVVTRSAFQRNAFWVERSAAAGEPYFLQDLPEELVDVTVHGWVQKPGGTLDTLQDVY